MPQIIHLTETGSTSRYLQERLRREALEEGSVVYADFQTAGRGQTGNRWESERGANLLFSVVIYPDCIPANAQFLISQIASLSVKETLERHTGGIRIKWPNDIYWNDRKICGMLIENDLNGAEIDCSVIGIGINLNQERFYGDAPNPVSLRQITGSAYGIETELHAFLDRFYAYYLRLLQADTEAIRREYAAALYRREGYHRYRDASGSFSARIAGIAPTGHLHLQLPDGSVRVYAFKEVAYLPE